MPRRYSRPKIKRDYSRKKYTNPFFRRPSRQVGLPVTGISLKLKVILALLITALVATLWFLLFSNYFLLSNIEVNLKKAAKISKTSSQEIKNLVLKQSREQKRFFVFSQRNLLLFDASQLSETLNDKYCLENLQISKKLPHTLVINLTEKNYAVIWQEDDSFYYVGSEGDIITEVNPTEIKQKQYPLIENLSQDKINNRKISVDLEKVNFIINLFSQFKKQAKDIDIEKFKIDSEFNTVKVTLKEGVELYFNVKDDINKQIEKLLTIRNQRLKDDFFKKTYIDLRYGDRVYYR